MLGISTSFQYRTRVSKYQNRIISGSGYDFSIRVTPKRIRPPQIVNYDGRIWCIEVENQNFLVERNGKTDFCGNTDEEYGHILEGSFTEESKCRPRNSKNASTALALSYYETYGLNVIVTRSCNVYGIRQHEEKFIPKIITNSLQNKKIPVYGDGENIRDWLYVEDICRAFETLIENGKSGEIYNISGRNEQKNIYVVKKYLK